MTLMTTPFNQELIDAAFDTLKAVFPRHFVALIIADDTDGTLVTNMPEGRMISVMRGINENRTAVTERDA